MMRTRAPKPPIAPPTIAPVLAPAVGGFDAVVPTRKIQTLNESVVSKMGKTICNNIHGLDLRLNVFTANSYSSYQQLTPLTEADYLFFQQQKGKSQHFANIPESSIEKRGGHVRYLNSKKQC